MKNKIIITSLISFVIFCLFNTAYADTTINLDIETDTGSIYNQNMNVAPCDSEGDGVMKETAYCALVQSGITSDWSGLWVNSINGVLNNDNSNGIYWMWLANLNTDNSNPSSSYNLSAKQYILNTDDKIIFYYNTNPLNISINNSNPTVGDNITITVTELGLDPSWNPIWNPATGGKVIIGADTYDLDVNGTYSLSISDTNPIEIKGQKDGFIDTSSITITPSSAPIPEPEHHSSGGSYVSASPIVSKTIFDTTKALDFLTSQQKENGSFGEELYTDWASIAFASSTDYQDQKTKLIKYFSENKFTGTSLTDYERHAMALMALNLNPYNVNSENYIQKIISNFDGEQFGDKNTDNDDIFALIVLQNAGYNIKDKIIQKTINFILSKQKENGSWNESIDLTGASMQSLASFNQDEKVKTSLEKAKSYLKEKQNTNGSWENVSSTSWAMQGMIAMGGKIDNATLEYLGENQDVAGGIKNENIQNRIWQTSYAINGVSEKTWNTVMQKFEKLIIVSTNPILEKVNNTNQIKFIKKVQKFQKPAPTIETPARNAFSIADAGGKQIQKEETTTPIKKKNIFRRILEALFRF